MDESQRISLDNAAGLQGVLQPNTEHVAVAQSQPDALPVTLDLWQPVSDGVAGPDDLVLSDAEPVEFWIAFLFTHPQRQRLALCDQFAVPEPLVLADSLPESVAKSGRDAKPFTIRIIIHLGIAEYKRITFKHHDAVAVA